LNNFTEKPPPNSTLAAVFKGAVKSEMSLNCAGNKANYQSIKKAQQLRVGNYELYSEHDCGQC